MSRRIVRTRKWLELNKIFFEIGAFTVLTVASIIVAYQANLIASAQTEIMRADVLPKIEIRSAQEQDPITGIYDSTYLIYNRGGKLSDFHIEYYAFLNVTHYGENSTGNVDIPIVNYWDWRPLLTGASQDLICTFKNGKNGVLEQKIRTDLAGKAYFLIDTYIRISYSTILGESVEKFMNISNNPVTITKDEWKEIVFKHNNGDQTLSFPKLEGYMLLKDISTK